MKPNVRTMVEGALAAALTVALSYVKLWEMPQGGSITLEAIPLLVFSLRRGVRSGVGAGAVAGLLQLLLGGYVVHPVQALLDYPLAFGALGLAGLVKRPLWAGTVLGSAARFTCHVLSGAVFFGSYAPKGTSVWLYSITYNGSYMLPNLVIAVIVVYLLWPRISRVSQA
jgi:thiamine transporter